MPAVAKNKQKSKDPSILKKTPLLISDKKFSKKIEKKINEDPKGIIFIKHLPHGFYEQQLRQFFEQFGEVLRVYLARSRKTLRSRGYGYIEFRYREVAEVAAEAINNYIMFGRIVKTQILPVTAKRIPKTFDKAFDENGNETSKYLVWKQNYIKRLNGNVSKAKIVKKKLKNLQKMENLKKVYADLGVEYELDAVIPKYDPEELEYPDEEKKRLEEDKKIRKQKEEDEESKIQITLDVMGEAAEPEETVLTSIVKSSAEDTLPIDDSSEDDEEDYRELDEEDWDKTLDVDTSVDMETSVMNKTVALEKAKTSKAKFSEEKTKQKPQKDKLLERIMANFANSQKENIEKPKANKKQKKESYSENSDSSPEKIKQKEKFGRKRLQGGIQKPKPNKKETIQHASKKALKKGAEDLAKNSNKGVKVVKGKDFKKKKVNKK